jgi:chromosomal replication initiation ATPase DnaA
MFGLVRDFAPEVKAKTLSRRRSDKRTREALEAAKARWGDYLEQARIEHALGGSTRITMKQITSEECERYGVSLNVVFSKSDQQVRKLEARCRQAIYYRCYTETVHSYTGIGRWCNRDQSTVSKGVGRHADRHNLLRPPAKKRGQYGLV